MHLGRWLHILGEFMALYDIFCTAVQTYSSGRPLDWFSLVIELMIMIL